LESESSKRVNLPAFQCVPLLKKAGISAMAISKYENSQSIPSSGVLIELSKALDVRGEYFFRSEEIELKNIEYRKHSHLPKKFTKSNRR